MHNKSALDAPPKPIIEKIRIRAMIPSDFNYIINSWLKNYKYSGLMVSRMRDKEYYPAYGPIIERLMKRCDVYVACLREDEDVVIGYLAIERKSECDIIHYILIKELWQKMGVGRYLLQAADPKPNCCFITHWTNPVQSLINKFSVIYNPFLVWESP